MTLPKDECVLCGNRKAPRHENGVCYICEADVKRIVWKQEFETRIRQWG